MRQFDILISRDRRPGAPFLVVLQHDSIDERGTVIVAPCIPSGLGPIGRALTPQIDIDGVAHLVLMTEMTALARSTLRDRKIVANVGDCRDSFTAAIDLIFTGV